MIPQEYLFQTDLFVDQCLSLASGNVTKGVTTERVLEKAKRFTSICNHTPISHIYANALSKSFDRPIDDLKLIAKWIYDETTISDDYHLKRAFPIFHDLFAAVVNATTLNPKLAFIEKVANVMF